LSVAEEKKEVWGNHCRKKKNAREWQKKIKGRKEERSIQDNKSARLKDQFKLMKRLLEKTMK